MNREKVEDGELRALSVGSMLLYGNDFRYIDRSLQSALKADAKAEVLLNLFNRMKFLEDFQLYCRRYDYVNFFDNLTKAPLVSNRELRQLYRYVESSYASPIRRQDCYEALEKHINRYNGEKLFNNGYIRSFVCEDFDQFCKEKIDVDKRKSIIEYTKEFARTEFGNTTRLLSAFQRFFLKNINEISEQKKVKSLVQTTQSSLDYLFSDDQVIQLQNLIKTDPIQEIGKLYATGSLTAEDHETLVDLFQSPEVDSLLNTIQKIKTRYEAALSTTQETIKQSINVIGSTFKNVRNIGSILDETSADLVLLMTQHLWNGNFTYPTVDKFALAVGKKLISKKTKNPENKSIEFNDAGEEDDSFMHEENNATSKSSVYTQDNRVEDNKLPDDNAEKSTAITIEKEDYVLSSPLDEDNKEMIQFNVPDNRKEFDPFYAHILKPYQEKYADIRQNRVNLHVTMLYLEHLGNYAKIIIDAYGNFDDKNYASARKAKESGKERMISQTPTMYYEKFNKKIRTADLFWAIEKYSGDINDAPNKTT